MGAQSPRVSVFEADEMVHIQIIKKKLEDAGIVCSISNKYLNSILSTPTATNTFIKVYLKDENKAFEIIDEYLKSNQN